jgi:hypothetical protein
MRGRVPIQRNRLRRTLVLDCLAKEGLGRSNVPFGAQMKVDCLAGPVDEFLDLTGDASSMIDRRRLSKTTAPVVLHDFAVFLRERCQGRDGQ